MTVEKILEYNNKAVFLSYHYDSALLGVTEIKANPVAAYDANKIIQIVMKRQKVSHNIALDFFKKEIINKSNQGDNQPTFIHTR